MMFIDRAVEMGLEVVGEGDERVAVHKGEFSTVAYVPLKTVQSSLFDSQMPGPVALYTKKDDNWIFNTVLSDSYNFVSFESLVESAKNSITRENSSILDEVMLLSDSGVSMKYQISIQNQNLIKDHDGIYIYPVVIVESAYNGTRANHMNFGIMIEENKDGNRVRKTLPIKSFGKIKSIHTESGKVDFNTPVGNLTSQMGSISDVISNMFDQPVNDDTLGSFLITVESIGKRSIQKISNQMATESQNIKTNFDVFRVILEYTDSINTINVREKFEDAIEKFFNFPAAVSTIIEDMNK